ncbi:hypothetical protein NKG05_10985 [Oerskovia sp. M15]
MLTRFTVGQALEELIGPEEIKEGSVEWEGREVPRKMSAREILNLTVCEPPSGREHSRSRPCASSARRTSSAVRTSWASG